MKLENGDKVKIISRDGETFSHPVGTILTVVDVEVNELRDYLRGVE